MQSVPQWHADTWKWCRQPMLLAACCFLHAACCTLLAARFLLHAACCTLLAARCTLLAACCTLLAACCLLHAACCTLLAACCLLHAACCTLHPAYCMLHYTWHKTFLMKQSKLPEAWYTSKAFGVSYILEILLNWPLSTNSVPMAKSLLANCRLADSHGTADFCRKDH